MLATAIMCSSVAATSAAKVSRKLLALRWSGQTTFFKMGNTDDLSKVAPSLLKELLSSEHLEMLLYSSATAGDGSFAYRQPSDAGPRQKSCARNPHAEKIGIFVRRDCSSARQLVSSLYVSSSSCENVLRVEGTGKRRWAVMIVGEKGHFYSEHSRDDLGIMVLGVLLAQRGLTVLIINSERLVRAKHAVDIKAEINESVFKTAESISRTLQASLFYPNILQLEIKASATAVHVSLYFEEELSAANLVDLKESIGIPLMQERPPAHLWFKAANDLSGELRQIDSYRDFKRVWPDGCESTPFQLSSYCIDLAKKPSWKSFIFRLSMPCVQPALEIVVRELVQLDACTREDIVSLTYLQQPSPCRAVLSLTYFPSTQSKRFVENLDELLRKAISSLPKITQTTAGPAAHKHGSFEIDPGSGIDPTPLPHEQCILEYAARFLAADNPFYSFGAYSNLVAEGFFHKPADVTSSDVEILLVHRRNTLMDEETVSLCAVSRRTVAAGTLQREIDAWRGRPDHADYAALLISNDTVVEYTVPRTDCSQDLVVFTVVRARKGTWKVVLHSRNSFVLYPSVLISKLMTAKLICELIAPNSSVSMTYNGSQNVLYRTAIHLTLKNSKDVLHQTIEKLLKTFATSHGSRLFTLFRMPESLYSLIFFSTHKLDHNLVHKHFKDLAVSTLDTVMPGELRFQHMWRMAWCQHLAYLEIQDAEAIVQQVQSKRPIDSLLFRSSALAAVCEVKSHTIVFPESVLPTLLRTILFSDQRVHITLAFFQTVNGDRVALSLCFNVKEDGPIMDKLVTALQSEALSPGTVLVNHIILDDRHAHLNFPAIQHTILDGSRASACTEASVIAKDDDQKQKSRLLDGSPVLPAPAAKDALTSVVASLNCVQTQLGRTVKDMLGKESLRSVLMVTRREFDGVEHLQKPCWVLRVHASRAALKTIYLSVLDRTDAADIGQIVRFGMHFSDPAFMFVQPRDKGLLPVGMQVQVGLALQANGCSIGADWIKVANKDSVDCVESLLAAMLGRLM